MSEVPIRRLREKVYTASPQWIASENFTNMTYQLMKTEDLVADNDGRFIVPSGTPYPSNDSDCIGLTFNDVDVTAGSAEVAVMIFGFIYEEKLPKPLTGGAKEALKGKIHPRNGNWSQTETRISNEEKLGGK